LGVDYATRDGGPQAKSAGQNRPAQSAVFPEFPAISGKIGTPI
jgi:hypothetical protein